MHVHNGSLRNIGPPTTFGSSSCLGLTFTRPHVAALEERSSNGWFMRTELQIIEVKLISNLHYHSNIIFNPKLWDS